MSQYVKLVIVRWKCGSKHTVECGLKRQPYLSMVPTHILHGSFIYAQQCTFHIGFCMVMEDNTLNLLNQHTSWI